MSAEMSSLAKYQIDTQENKEFMHAMTERLLSFGHRFASPGGGSYYLGDDGTPWTKRPRETWITSRMAHVYSLGTMLGHDGSEALTDAALKGLCGELHDAKSGGWYAGRTADGGILPTKQCYAHAFVILAASSAVAAGRPGAQELLNDALETYDRYFWMEEEGLSCDLWDTDFTKMDDYRGLNANMHTVEAFLAAADVTGDAAYRVRAGRIIDRVLVWAKENAWRIPEHFTKEWVPELNCNRERPDDPFKPFGATPGHGIEWARLIAQWAVSTYPAGPAGTGEEAEKSSPEHCALDYIKAARALFDRAVADAWQADGVPGLCYTTDWEGEPVVHDRMHWTLAEAINTSATLYRITKDTVYAKWYARFLAYLDASVLDPATGSWFHQLDQHNRPLTTVWPGKPDIYHALQATLIPYSRVDLSISCAVSHLVRG